MKSKLYAIGVTFLLLGNTLMAAAPVEATSPDVVPGIRETAPAIRITHINERTSSEKNIGKKNKQVKKRISKNVKVKSNSMATQEKSQFIAALFAFFLGYLGVHRFYLGYTWQGVVQFFTLGGLGVWYIIDLIRILVGDLKEKGTE